MREATVAPATAFPGNGQQRLELAEIAALKKEVARLKAERDIQKRPLLTSRGKRQDVRVRCEATAYLAGQLDGRGPGRLSIRLSRLAQTTVELPGNPRREARHVDRQELQGQRSDLWRPPGLARCSRRRAGLRTAPDRAPDAAERHESAAEAAWKAEGRWRTLDHRRQHPRPGPSEADRSNQDVAGRLHLHPDRGGLADVGLFNDHREKAACGTVRS